jgi:hypothetical protein
MSDEKPCVSPSDSRHVETLAPLCKRASSAPATQGRAEWQREQDIASVRAGHCPGHCKDALACRENGCQYLATEYGL